MAGKKIGLVLALDGEKEFVQAVQTAKKETKLFETQLKDLSEKFDGNANSMEYLQKKQELLTEKQGAYQKRLEAAQSGLEKANNNYRDQGKRLEELEKELSDAKEAQEEMQKAGEEGTEAYEKQSKAVENLEKAVEKQRIARTKEAGSIADWEKQLYEAETALEKNNSELQKNEKYLNEARQASDKCATSIDKMGKEVKDTGDDFEETNKEVSTFSDMLKANLAGTAIVEGLKQVGDAAVEAGKYVVEVGSNFEEAMSQVEAISGASGSELAALTEKAKEMGSSTKFSATEAANAFQYMSLAGWNTQQSLSGIDGVLSLAAASGMDLAAASDMVTDYLSAFGMEAEDASYMADMLASAQAASNTTAEMLGEAYKNCAANMHAAGQDIETTTSLLEAMANQGLKGSEAGTALSAMMRDITQKMSDGKIAIGNTSITVQKANGDYRDLTDILADVEAATKDLGSAQKNEALMSTFTSDSLKGLNMVFTEGMDKVSGYEEALRNSEGAAAKMAETMQDNSKGDLTTMNSALEGLGIAVYDYVDGPLRGVVQGVTGMIGGITEAITPQKTILEEFIDDITESNKEVQSLLEESSKTWTSANDEVESMEMYKDIILELNDIENKSEYQKYQLKDAVDNLASSVPELAEAWDDEAGKIDLSSEAIESLIEKQESYLLQQAAMEAAEESYKALYQAQLNAVQAQEALTEATKDFEKSKEVVDEYGSAVADTYGDYKKAQKAVEDANDAVETATNQYNSMKNAIDETNQKMEEATETVESHKDELNKATDAAGETSDAISDVGDATVETERELDALGRDITSLSDEAKEAAKEAAQEIVDAYDNVREGLKDSIESSFSIFDEFAEQTPITINEMIKNLNSQIDNIAKWEENMTELASKIGNGMSQELYDSLVQMGPEQTAAAVQTLVDAAEGQAEKFKEVSDLYELNLNLKANSETLAKNTTAGKAYAEAAAGGMAEGAPEMESASETVAAAAVEKLESYEENFRQSGQTATDVYAAGIKENANEASWAMNYVGSVAYSAVQNYERSFYNVGYNASAAVASGINAGASLAINAVMDMAAQTLAAAQKVLEIHSPSRKFREEVGQNISESTAFGIDDKASLAGDSAAKMSASVYKKATAWLDKYKKSHKVSLEDEQYFWEQIVKHTKNGTAACEKAINQLSAANSNLIGSTLNKQISNNFGVTWKEDENASAFSDGQKSIGDYYSEVYNAAKKTLSNYKVLHEMSLEQEVAYWEKVKKTIMTGTDVWYDVTSTINGLKEDIVTRDEEANNAILENAEKYIDRQKILGDVSTEQELDYWKSKINLVEKNSDAYFEILEKINDLEAEKVEEQAERLQSIASVQDKLLSNYKTYYKVSAQAEVQYWDIARKQFQTGTQERIDADQKYFYALQELYDQRKELDEDYAESSKEINEELKESVEELQETYKDAVASRKQDILSSMNLFESWDASGYDADTLIYNLKTQVEGLALWEQKLEELKARGISTDLYEYLLDQGPDAAANIYSLANATDEQLAEYQKLFNQRSELAQSQALKDNEELLKETNKQISQLQKDSQRELDSLNAEYSDALAELNLGISASLKSLVENAENIGEDTVSGLIAGIGIKADSVETYQSTTKLVQTVTSGLSALKEESGKIGSDALEKLLKGLNDNEKITQTAQKAVESVKYAMETAFAEEYGELNYAGITKLNRLMEYAPQNNTVVNVDNSGLASLLGTLISTVNNLGEKLDNQQMVLDTGTLVAEIQPLISQESAAITVRRKRGRL